MTTQRKVDEMKVAAQERRDRIRQEFLAQLMDQRKPPPQEEEGQNGEEKMGLLRKSTETAGRKGSLLYS